MSELRDRIRAQQAGADQITGQDVERAFLRHLVAHQDHPWHKVGRCVYCGPCGTRLYQGTMPKDHEVYVPPPSEGDKRAAEMRARWGK